MATSTDDVLNQELQAQMSGTKDRAHGWIGSKYVGVDAAMAGASAPKPSAAPGSLPPPPTAPPVVGSQGKLPGEWIGSKYVGPAQPAAAPAAPSAPPTNAPAPVSTPAIPATHSVQAPESSVDAPASDFGGGIPAQQAQQIADAKNAAAPAGFDAGKWKTGTDLTDSHKYVGGEILAAGGNRAAILANPKFAGWKAGTKPDEVISPEGSVYDIWYDFGGPNQRPQWQYKGGGPAGTRNDGIVGNDPNGGAAAAARSHAAAGTGTVNGGGGGAVGAGGAGGTGGGGGTGAGGDYPFPNDPALDDAIKRLLARGEAPVNRAAVEDQYSPVAAVIQRNAERQQAQAAERAAFQGTNIGGAGGSLDAEAQQINEAAGTKQGELMAGLITSELTQRRADVVNALGFAQGEQKMRLQAQLAALDRELERQRMAQQNQQYYDDLGFRIGDREAYWNDQEADRL